jgi:hypothetical protein
MIDLRHETTCSLSQAAKLLPPGRRGRPVSLSCLLRWVLDGVRTPNGPVRLEAVRLGGRWITSLEALQRFAAAQTPTLGADPINPVTRPSVVRQRASETAARQLDKLGI